MQTTTKPTTKQRTVEVFGMGVSAWHEINKQIAARISQGYFPLQASTATDSSGVFVTVIFEKE